MQPSFLLQFDDPMKVLAIALGGFGLIYLVVRPMSGKKNDPLERPAPTRGLGQQRVIEREMQSLLVEYEQMIRNMTASLDLRPSTRNGYPRGRREDCGTAGGKFRRGAKLAYIPIVAAGDGANAR